MFFVAYAPPHDAVSELGRGSSAVLSSVWAHEKEDMKGIRQKEITRAEGRTTTVGRVSYSRVGQSGLVIETGAGG